MRNKTDIYQLVHALSPNEKGYFKKYCSRSGQRDSIKYIELFDLISKELGKDEEHLKTKIKDKRLLKNLSADKHYLFDQVLHSLVVSESTSGSRESVLSDIIKCRVLYQKSLYPLAFERLKKVQKRCADGFFHELLLECLDMELHFWQYLNPDERRPVRSVFMDRADVFRKLYLEEDARQLNLEVLWSFTAKGVGRSSEVIMQREKWLATAQDIATRLDREPNQRALIYNLNTFIFLYNTLDRLQETKSSILKLLEVLDTEPMLKEEFMTLYVSSLNNAILAHLYEDEIDDAEKHLAVMRQLKGNSLRSQLAIFISRVNSELEYFNRIHDYEGGCRVSEEMKSDLLKLEAFIPLHSFIHMVYFSFRANFYSGKYKEALFWIQYMTRSDHKVAREEVASVTRLSEILLHYEMKNFELVSSLAQSAIRYLQKKKKLFQFEEAMLQFFRQAERITNEKAAFSELKEKIDPILENHLEARVLMYFDFQAYCMSKITANPLLDF